jgi:hypothetical protein
LFTRFFSDWWPDELRLRVLRVTPELVSSRFEIRPRGASFVCEVGRVDPSREMLIRYVKGAHRGTGLWTLEAVEGGTRACYAVDLEPHGWLVPLLSNFLDLGRMHSESMVRLFDGFHERLRRG